MNRLDKCGPVVSMLILFLGSHDCHTSVVQEGCANLFWSCFPESGKQTNGKKMIIERPFQTQKHTTKDNFFYHSNVNIKCIIIYIHKTAQINHVLTLPNYKLPTYCRFSLSKSSLISNNNHLKSYNMPDPPTITKILVYFYNHSLSMSTSRTQLNKKLSTSCQAFYFLFNFNIFIKRRGVNILSRTRLEGCYIILRVYSPKPKKTPCPTNEKDQVRKTDLSSGQPQVGGAQPHQLAQGSRLDCLLGQVNAPPQRLIAPAQGNDNNCNLLFPSCYTICLNFFFLTAININCDKLCGLTWMWTKFMPPTFTHHITPLHKYLLIIIQYI